MKFYIIINDEQQGPFTIDELTSKRITPFTEVWTEGMDDWKIASEVPRLATIIKRTRTVPPARKKSGLDVTDKHVAKSRPVARVTPKTHDSKKDEEITLWGYSFNKRKFLTITLGIVLLLLLIITNPSQRRHSEAVQQNISAYMNGNIDQVTGSTGDLGNLIGEAAKTFTGIGGSLASNFVTRSNYLICSVGHIGNKSVSFGILGMVFTFDDWLDETFGVAKGVGEAANSIGNAVQAIEKLDNYSNKLKKNNRDSETQSDNDETDKLLDSMEQLVDNVETLTNRVIHGNISEGEMKEQDEYLGQSLKDHQERLNQLSKQGKVSAAQKRRAEQITSRLLSLKNKIGDNL